MPLGGTGPRPSCAPRPIHTAPGGLGPGPTPMRAISGGQTALLPDRSVLVLSTEGPLSTTGVGQTQQGRWESRTQRCVVRFEGGRLTVTFTLNLSHCHWDPCPRRHSGSARAGGREEKKRGRVSVGGAGEPTQTGQTPQSSHAGHSGKSQAIPGPLKLQRSPSLFVVKHWARPRAWPLPSAPGSPWPPGHTRV